MLDLTALRAAALQTRRNASEKVYIEEQEDGELVESRDLSPDEQRNQTNIKDTNRNTPSHSHMSDNAILQQHLPPSKSSTVAQSKAAQPAVQSNSSGNPQPLTIQETAESSSFTYDKRVEEELLSLSAMGVESDALVNFGFHKGAILRFCKEHDLPLPSFASDALKGTKIPVEKQNQELDRKERRSSASTDSVVRTPPLPATTLQQKAIMTSEVQYESESDMEISDVSEEEGAGTDDGDAGDFGDSDVEDMDVEDTVGTSTIITTSTTSDNLVDIKFQSSNTANIQGNATIPSSTNVDAKSVSVPVPVARQHTPLIQARDMKLRVDVSDESDGETELAYEFFKPVLPEIRLQGKKPASGEERESEIAANKNQDTDALQARFKQIADMKKMIEQLEQLKKKEKAIASDEDSPPSSSVGMVTPTLSTTSSAASPNAELKKMEETTAELVAHAEIVVKAANPQQLSALKSNEDNSVTQLFESVEQKLQNEYKQPGGDASADVIMENAASAEVYTTSAANSTNGTEKSAVESSPMTAYEEQLKSLQELENEQDEALQALDLKIQEMRKQQADVIMRKEQAKTKALGVRAKLSMLLRASSASPKVRSSSVESPQPTSLPEKRSSSTTNKDKGSVEALWPSKRSKFNSDASLSKTSTFDNLHMTMDEIVNYPRNEKYPLFNDIRDILAKIISRRYSRPKAKHQATVRITDTRHDHLRIVNNLQDCLKYFVSTSTPPPQSSDTPASNQSDVSAKLKDHGRSHDTSTFTPYQSPLQRFRSYQYFGGPSGRSMAYSNPVDTSRNLCTFELAGGNCNDDTCASRHFRDFDMTGTDVMQDLLTYAQGEYEEGRSQYPKTLKRIFASLDAANSTSPASLIRTAADCRRRLPDERLQKVSFVPSIARRSEKVNRRTAPHSVKPVSQKSPMTSALQRVLLSGSSGDTRYFDVDERNYPRDPKNIQGWIRAVVAALPSSNFADYDKTNSKSLDLDGAINILRQALARNPSSDLLWCLYVELWLYRGDLKMFEREMEQAIRNVPFYLDLMWYKVLAAPTVEEQITISDQLLEHFNSERAITSIDDTEISSALLEILCRQAAILIANERYQVAKQLLAGVLSSASVVRAALKLRDQVLLAACYFHVCIYERVPTIVFRRAKRNQGDTVPLFIVIWNEAVAASSFQDILCVICFERLLEATLSDASDADHILFLAVLGNLLEYLKAYSQVSSDIISIKNRLEESNFLSPCTEL